LNLRHGHSVHDKCRWCTAAYRLHAAAFIFAWHGLPRAGRVLDSPLGLAFAPLPQGMSRNYACVRKDASVPDTHCNCESVRYTHPLAEHMPLLPMVPETPGASKNTRRPQTPRLHGHTSQLPLRSRHDSATPAPAPLPQSATLPKMHHFPDNCCPTKLTSREIMGLRAWC
jgi:hypothetical protein